MTEKRMHEILQAASNITVMCDMIAWLRHERTREIYWEELKLDVCGLFNQCGVNYRPADLRLGPVPAPAVPRDPGSA